MKKQFEVGKAQIRRRSKLISEAPLAVVSGGLNFPSRCWCLITSGLEQLFHFGHAVISVVSAGTLIDSKWHPDAPIDFIREPHVDVLHFNCGRMNGGASLSDCFLTYRVCAGL